MKRNQFIIAVALLGTMSLYSCSGNKAENTEKVVAEATTSAVKEESKTANLEASVVAWEGTMLGVYSHSGVLKFSEANIVMAEDKLVGGSFTVDMGTMVATDENYNVEEGKTPEKLVGHLKSADFFDVENHSTAQFTITSVEGTTATGTLTVRGKSNEEKVENIQVATEGGATKVSGSLTFDRKKYDVSYDVAAADMVLSDEIELSVELVLN